MLVQLWVHLQQHPILNRQQVLQRAVEPDLQLSLLRIVKGDAKKVHPIMYFLFVAEVNHQYT